ncbi:MAG: hypothetical protein Fur0041_02130 [Bacteroidia bacterium]
MYLNEDHVVKIIYKGKYKMGNVMLKGGSIEKKNDSVFTLNATTGGEAVLVVNEKLKNGSERVAFSKTYKLYGRETPRVYLDNVPNDSVADKFNIIALGKLKARQKYGNDPYIITSFKLYIRNGNKFDTLSTTGDRLTPEMKKKIDAIDVRKNGGILMFEEIKAMDPNGKIIDLPPLRIFLVDPKRMGFGL